MRLARTYEPHAIHLDSIFETNSFCLLIGLQARSQDRTASRRTSHTFPASISYRSVRTTSYEKAIYRPFADLILSAAHRLRRMQTGNIQVYLLYIFLTLVSSTHVLEVSEMKIAINVLQALIFILGAPLVRGIIARCKACLQRRQGASIWRPYADLAKLFRKEDLFLRPHRWCSVLRPLCCLGQRSVWRPLSQWCSLPRCSPPAVTFSCFVYLLALGRFFLSLGAFDGGSAFGGMGASREALVSSLAEAPFLLGLVAVAILAAHADIAGMVAWTLQQNVFNISAVHILAFMSLAMVVMAETGRMPVDNPTTHLELTMIHEGMVLEYSGPQFGLDRVGERHQAPRNAGPFDCVVRSLGNGVQRIRSEIVVALLLYCAKIAAADCSLAVIESGVAKLRMYLVPDFLGVASAVSALAVIFTMLDKR